MGTILKETAFHDDKDGDGTVDVDHQRSILYFLGTAFPVMLMWFDKLHYDARFTLTTSSTPTPPNETVHDHKDSERNDDILAKEGSRRSHISKIVNGSGIGLLMGCSKAIHGAKKHKEEDDDLFHRWLEVLQICAVATALSRIRTPEVMSDMCRHNDMFMFSFSLFLNNAIMIGRYFEVVFFVVECDLPAAKVAARRDMERLFVPTFFYLAAAVYSCYLYYFSYSQYHDAYGYGKANSYGESSCQEWDNTKDLPIYLCLGGWLSSIIVGYVMDVLAYSPPGSGYSKLNCSSTAKRSRMVEMSVPRNILFCMHRYDEWFMLMFGESIISLLIVDGHNESPKYKLAFFSGIISVIVLAHWHYGSVPHNPDEHALSRSRHSAYLYGALVPIYSVALIAVGVSYKLFLYEYTYKEEGEAHRTLLQGAGTSMYAPTSRLLDNKEGGNHNDYYWVGGGDNKEQNSYYQYYAYDGEDDGNRENSHASYSSEHQKDEMRQQFAANVFCVSMAMVLVCMDLRFILHKGIPKLAQQAQKVSKLALVGFCVSRYTVIILLATLSMLYNEPHVMAACSLAAMIFLQFLSNAFLHHFGQSGGDMEGHESDLAKPIHGESEPATKSSDSDFLEMELDSNDSVWFTTGPTENSMQPFTKENLTLTIFERQSLLDDVSWVDTDHDIPMNDEISLGTLEDASIYQPSLSPASSPDSSPEGAIHGKPLRKMENQDTCSAPDELGYRALDEKC